MPALLISAVQPLSASEAVRNGQDIATRLCASCHAIGQQVRSPIAAATAFRLMLPKVNLDRMAERLRTGVVIGHPEMPAFVLRESDTLALVAYIKSLQPK
jgi:mono/diheme cytochrome c family protein